MHRTLISAAVLALAGLSAQPVIAAPAAAPAARATTQLPRSVRPTHYDVALTPDAARSTFAGKVAITLEVLNPTDIDHAQRDRPGVLAAPRWRRPPAARRSRRRPASMRTRRPPPSPSPGRSPRAATGSRSTTQGVIGQQAVGLFSLDYDTAAGKKRALYTQFENSDARRMIPSWDEPAYKASFALRSDRPGRPDGGQ